MEIIKFFRGREFIATCAQICMIAVLLPFIGILFGIILVNQGAAQKDFMSALLSYMPYSDQIQAVFLGAELVSLETTVKDYLWTMYEALVENGLLGLYVGMWIHTFRVIFKEIIPLKGLPLIQIVLGLLFGALTLVMVQDANPFMLSMIILFIVLLNVLLTAIFVRKSIWQKLLDIIFIAYECLLTPLVSGYVVVFGLVFKGYYTDIKTAISLILIVSGLMIVYTLIQYIIIVKKG